MTANIALALAIIVILFPLALFGVLGLAGVVLVHEVAEVAVILNGVRASRLPLRSGDIAVENVRDTASQRTENCRDNECCSDGQDEYPANTRSAR